MADQNTMPDTTPGDAPTGPEGSRRFPANSAGQGRTTQQAGRVPYRRHVPHVTQAPIDDIEPEYVMPERYTTVAQAGAARRHHMGVATSDPQYLPPTGNEERETRIRQPHGTRTGVPTALPQKQGGKLHYDRYLQTPKNSRSIFASRRERQRAHVKTVLFVLIALVIVLVLVWLIFLR